MKTMLVLVALAVMCLSLSACSGSGFEDTIIGAWEGSSTVNEETHDSQWEFFKDGTMIMTVYTILDTQATFAGSFAFEDEDTITLRLDEEEPNAEPGRRDIRMPDEDTLILTAPVSGAQAVLKRVQEP